MESAMARLPSREEIDYAKQQKAAQLPKLLLDLGIDATVFDAAIYSIAKDQSLSLAPFRGEIIETCYYLYARTAPDAEIAQVRKAIRQVEQIPRRKDPLAALLRLRKKWTDETVDDACLAGLWSELCCDLVRFGNVFVERLGRFHISRFRKAQDVRLCVKAACDECRSWWNHRDDLHRARPKDDPFRDWIVHLAIVFESAGGRLLKSWASWRSDLTRDHSPFVAFLLPLMKLLPTRCKKSDTALGEFVKETGRSVRDGRILKARPFYAPLGRLILPLSDFSDPSDISP